MKLQHLIFKSRFVITGLSLTISALVFFCYILIKSTDNPINIQHKFTSKIYEFTPQGWAYFTRDPREAQVLLYKLNIETDKLTSVHLRHSSYKNFFGINRNSTKMLSEIQAIKEKLNDTLFTKGEWNFQKSDLIEKVNLDNTKLVSLTNEIFDPILCGKYVLVFQKAVPWAWSKNYDGILMPSQIIRLDIKCSKS